MIPVISRRAAAAHHGREGTVSTAVHVALALVLTLVLAGQARAFAAVLRSRRAVASRRPPRRTELVWIVIPVVVVLFLAARSWIIALDLGSPAMATMAPVNVSARSVSLSIVHR
jgi:heme/copper-type cytochrome/quinol oxidase subunit 2